MRGPLSAKSIPRNVLLTGLTSFFTDVSSEMVYPLLQAFVSLVLAAQKALLGPILGIIEGVAESTASLLKVFSGYYSDRWERRKLPAIGGYAGSALAKLLLFLAGFGWYFVLASRFLDRVGKGIRTALGALLSFLLVRRFLDPATGNLHALSDFYRLFLQRGEAQA